MESYTKACEEVKSAGEWSKAIPNERKLISYGLFKQITSGDNTSAAPWAIQYEQKAKWSSWEGFKGKSKEDCMALYVEEWEKQKVEYNK